MQTQEPGAGSNLTRAVWLVALMGAGVVLYFAQDVLIPVAMAVFLAMLLTPAVDRLQRWGLRRGFAVGMVMFLVFACAAAAINAVWDPANEWLARAPQTMRQIDPRLRPLREIFQRFDAVAERAGRLAQGNPSPAPAAIIAPVAEHSSAITVTKSLLEGLTVIPLTLFFLLGGPPLLARMGASLSGNEASARTLRLTEAIRYEVGRYFATVALINVCLGACTALAMYALDMPNAILWGVLVAVFNFVPYLGPIAAFFILAVAALLTFDTLGRALAVPGVFLCLHLIEGQLVQPLTVGRRFEVNALVVLLAVWFGYGFWGIPGMLLAMPVVVALKVATQYQPEWRTVRDFLSPNGRWQPRSPKRARVPKPPEAEPQAREPGPVATRGS